MGELINVGPEAADVCRQNFWLLGAISQLNAGRRRHCREGGRRLGECSLAWGTGTIVFVQAVVWCEETVIGNGSLSVRNARKRRSCLASDALVSQLFAARFCRRQ